MIELATEIGHIAGARLASGDVVDLEIVDGVIAAVHHGGSPRGAHGERGELDLDGWLLLPSGVEPHAHVDKAFSWSMVDQVYGDLGTAIASWRGYAEVMTSEDVYRRARRAFTSYLANGITAVRTHVDLLGGPEPLRGIEAVLRLRDELRDVMDIQVVLLCSYLSPREDLLSALRMGVDVMGGCPHLAPDPDADTMRALDLAEQFGLPVDLHTDEQLDAGMLSIRALAREVSRRGLSGRAAASHCVSLGSLEPDVLAEVVDEVKAAGLGIVSLPITNLYLQGREHSWLTPRGITALRALLDAGVDVAAGGDNIRDPFNPMGRADLFETTSLLVTAGHLDAGQALDAVTRGGRSVLGLPPAGTAVGDVADLVAVRADSLADALAGPGDERIVLRRGRVVSHTTVRTDNAVDHLLDSVR